MKIRVQFASIAALLASPGLLLAENSFRYGACNGSYAVHSSGAVAEAAPLSMPVGQPIQSGAEVKMGQCGREMTVMADGLTAVLYQEVMDDRSYSGSIDMGDGAARTLTLRVGDDRNLRGAIVASDSNMSVTRPLWFMLTDATETRFEGCEDDNEEPFAPRGISAEGAVVINQLSSIGITPAGDLDYTDYVTMQSPDAQSARVSLRLSGTNAVLPHPEVAIAQMDSESALCLTDERLDPATSILDLKVEYADDDPFVFLRLIDAGSGKIMSQVEGVPSVAGDGALQSAVADAWQKLAPATGQMTDGVIR